MQDKSTKIKPTSKAKRSTRNRKRSKRRSIFCEVHDCYLESRSPKYHLSTLFANNEKRKKELSEFLLSFSDVQNSDDIREDWIEAFQCFKCREIRWYHITETGLRIYQLKIVPSILCEGLAQEE